MSVYHNPKAKHPIPISFFEGLSGRQWFENGQYDNLFRDFSPYSSVTVTDLMKGYEHKLLALDELLRQEADKKAEEWAAIMNDETKFLAWRDKFVG